MASLREPPRDYVCIKIWAELRSLEVGVPVGFLATPKFSRQGYSQPQASATTEITLIDLGKIQYIHYARCSEFS